MGKGYKHGVSAYDLLDFSITAYATEEELQSEVPAENTIGIVTTRAIKGWSFQSQAPESPVTGMVWILTGKESVNGFNALKEEALWLYPLSARQYVSGDWCYVPAFAVREGLWSYWWNGELFCKGNEIQYITGGWESAGDAGTTTMNAYAPELNRYSTYMQIKLVGYRRRGYVSMANPVDMTNFTQVEMAISNLTMNGDYSEISFEIVDEAGNVVMSESVTAAGTYTMDISSLTGIHNVRITIIAANYGSVNFRLNDMHLL